MVPTQLLDLSDDIIDRIAYFVHRDYDVPLPSFNPHWANFVTELDRGLATDYLALRSTCTRIRGICGLKGLHLFLRSWQRVLEWMADAPDSVVKGIRRLSLDIEWKYWPPELKKLDENAEIDTTNGHGIYPLIPTWSTITTLLSRFTSLEELYLSHSPLCQHRPKFTMTSQLKCPPLDFLPQLKSLAFEIRCSRCSVEIPSLFIPACTTLQHIKMVMITHNEGWDKLFDSWQRRHPELKLALKTLVLNLDSEASINDELKRISKWGMGLKELHMIKVDRGGLEPGFFLGGKQVESTGSSFEQKWVFKHFEQEWITGLSDDDSNGEGWEENKAWTEFLGALSKYHNLETFDCVINPHIDQGWPRNVIPHDEQKASEYNAYQKGMRTSLERYKTTQPKLSSAMAAAARAMVETVPTLKNGYFWQYPYDWNSEPAHIWRRWSWQRGGFGGIKVEPVVELFASEWMINGDGEGHPDYQDQDSDDE
ncbi:uncharacterized protein I303_107135 [Kwoniella dejecticola CBS 10117]|uniref:Uncharacterized protein n=1 Tax=Kwoniella dejecticola CBS 10117 TaxID=1296121 RepID=A0A1A5ZYU1_9TREE|nr:uncharacterized protein I303_06537 [Kwoniella dejecticola CBS 10117]OBR82979.1 hypothetical protein I303_06537 [Kwoniella dejecticola CBS 10117]